MTQITLNDSVESLPGIGASTAEKLRILGIFSIQDLILYPPIRFDDTREITSINELTAGYAGEKATIRGRVVSVNNIRLRGRKTLTQAQIEDESGRVTIGWFNQPYLLKNLQRIETGIFHVKVSSGARRYYYCTNYQDLGDTSGSLGKYSAKYALTRGISQKKISKFIKTALNAVQWDKVPDFSEKVLSHFELISFKDAVRSIHFPKDEKESEMALKRLAQDELVSVMTEIERQKKLNKKSKAIPIDVNETVVLEKLSQLPFTPTSDQVKSIKNILDDISKSEPMHRLLNGDVGTGKTLVSQIASLATIKAGYSVLVMAPTTVLASQHYESFVATLPEIKQQIRLLKAGESYTQTHDAELIISTHALLYQDELPQNIGLIVIDEQHRFGVVQRERLVKEVTRDHQPHYLSMTATPIPRTLTNVLYGDLDISVIEEKPSNRKDIETKSVTASKREDCYIWLAQECERDSDTQAYVVFTQIDESDTGRKALNSEYEQISKTYFSKVSHEKLHGRLKNDKKAEIISRFEKGDIQVLFSTTVVEVGVDNPNASLILVENPENFGLAQLHQLRGRVGRGVKQSSCYLLLSNESADSRISYFKKTHSGFDLAEYDLKHRGPGEIFGARQSGLPQFNYADITDRKSIEIAKSVSKMLIDNGIEEPPIKLFSQEVHQSD